MKRFAVAYLLALLLSAALMMAVAWLASCGHDASVRDDWRKPRNWRRV